MKLQSNKKKTTIKILIVVAAVLLLVGLVWLVISGITSANEAKEGKEIKFITLNATPKSEYLVGEEFDATGTIIQVMTKNMDNTYFVDNINDMTFSGFDSSKAVDEQVITVSYQGFTTTFTVKIKEEEKPAPTLVSIEVRDLHTTYTMARWNQNGPSLANAYLVLTYSDGSTKGSLEETPLLWKYIEPLSDVEGAGTTQMVINYTEGEGENAIVVSTTVTITITN